MLGINPLEFQSNTVCGRFKLGIDDEIGVFHHGGTEDTEFHVELDCWSLESTECWVVGKTTTKAQRTQSFTEKSIVRV